MQPSIRRIVTVVLLGLCVAGNAHAARKHRRQSRAAIADTIRSSTCGRTCLNAFVDRYLEALIAHDPERVELAPGFRATENGVSVPAGAGLWRSVTDIGAYHIRAIDPVTREAAFLGMLIEGERASPFMLRLEVHRRRVVEAETIIARDAADAPADAELRPGNVRRDYADRSDPEDRLPRATLLRVAKTYYDGIEGRSGEAAPFAEDCQRIDNGLVRPCGDGITPGESGAESAGDRRPPLVDEERGIVVTFMRQKHTAASTCAGTAASSTACPSVDMPPTRVEIAEFMRLGDGRIRALDSVRTELPPGVTTGW